MGKRKQVEKYIIDMITELTGTDFNKKLYIDLFKKMNDKEFHEFMLKLKDGDILNIIVPHDKGSTNITIEKNFKLYKKLGEDFFKHIVYESSDPSKPNIKSKYKFYNLLLPFRRTKQTSDKGLAVAKDDKQTDAATGQVINDSRTTKLNFQELQILNGMGLKDSASELFSDRGGSTSGRVLKQMLMRYGKVSKEILKNYDKDILSNNTLKSYFNGMHLKINP